MCVLRSVIAVSLVLLVPDFLNAGRGGCQCCHPIPRHHQEPHAGGYKCHGDQDQLTCAGASWKTGKALPGSTGAFLPWSPKQMPRRDTGPAPSAPRIHMLMRDPRVKSYRDPRAKMRKWPERVDIGHQNEGSAWDTCSLDRRAYVPVPARGPALGDSSDNQGP